MRTGKRTAGLSWRRGTSPHPAVVFGRFTLQIQPSKTALCLNSPIHERSKLPPPTPPYIAASFSPENGPPRSHRGAPSAQGSSLSLSARTRSVHPTSIVVSVPASTWFPAEPAPGLHRALEVRPMCPAEPSGWPARPTPNGASKQINDVMSVGSVCTRSVHLSGSAWLCPPACTRSVHPLPRAVVGASARRIARSAPTEPALGHQRCSAALTVPRSNRRQAARTPQAPPAGCVPIMAIGKAVTVCVSVQAGSFSRSWRSSR